MISIGKFRSHSVSQTPVTEPVRLHAKRFFSQSGNIGTPQCHKHSRLWTPTKMFKASFKHCADKQASLSSIETGKVISKAQAAIRKEVAKKFVLGTHMAAIETASNKGHFIISFREAGEPTLEKLALGAPAKGHDIEEKTIKEGSIRNSYPPAQADAILAAMKNAGLLGYVGHWEKIIDEKTGAEKTGALLGVYIGPGHRLGDRANEKGIYKFDIAMHGESMNDCAGKPPVRIDMDKLDASLASLKAQENWQALPFTGDYDLHDMISLIGQRATVPSNSLEEARIVNTLNEQIAAGDLLRCGKPIEYNTVRHGAQVAYIAFALGKKEPIVEAVAKASYPLAFIYKGEWTIARNADEHVAFYKKNRVNMKVNWLPPTDAGLSRRHSH